MPDLSYNNVVQSLEKRIPEFTQSEEYKDLEKMESLSLPYIVFGALRRFYDEQYLKNKRELIKKLSQFLEEMANSKETDLVNLLAVGFLENISPFKSSYKLVRETFGPKTKKLLDDVLAN